MYRIREIRQDEIGLLEEFLYLAIYVPEGEFPPPRDVLDEPELQVYIEDFGEHPEDRCLVAEADGRVVGAVWTRDMRDYGHVADGVPSFAISLLPESRGKGVGAALMRGMLDWLRKDGCDRASLSVQKDNYAFRLYRKLGFEIVEDHADEYIMICELS